ncbi:MAG: hypothetical protein KA354_16150 [Phycisphaerae bacterium]|nr:hypothetical protein [Phycisphaerae bacterium]
MGLYEGGGQLAKAMKELMRHWAETRSSWDDAAAKDFEERYMIPLQMEMRSVVGAMSQISTLIERIRRDCR